MLTHLRLKNFKSWKDTGDIALRPITAIFGANSSGKSALIQALLLLKQTAEANDRNLTFHFGGPNALVDLGDFASVSHQHDVSVPVELALGWERVKPLVVADADQPVASSKRMAFSVRAGRANDSSVEPEQMRYRLGSAEFGMRRRPKQPTRFNLYSSGSDFSFEPNDRYPMIPGIAGLSRPIKCYGFPGDARLFYRNATFLQDLAFALEERLSRIYYLGPLRAQPQREYRWSGASPTDVGHAGELAVDAVLGSDRTNGRGSNGPATFEFALERQVSDLFAEIGLLHEFRVKQIGDSSLYRAVVRPSKNSPRSLITDVGFGVSQILPVLVLCFYAPKGSTVILEQPEIHLHPAVQSALGDVLIAARQQRKVQIIVESHSEHLLRRLQRRIAEEKLPESDLGAYFCENDGAESKLTTLELNPYGSITNWPNDFFGDDFGEIAEMSKAELRRRMSEATG